MSATPIEPVLKFQSTIIDNIKLDIQRFLLIIDSYSINGFTSKSIKKQLNTYAELVYLYLYDERVFSVAYSGGKDSTVSLDVVLKSLMLIKNMYNKELDKKTFVLFSDTLLEMDSVINGIYKSLENIDKFSKKHNLNIEVKRVSPTTKNTYFSLLIGKGYMMPSRNSKRWCTDRMKIQPQKKGILEILNSNKNGFIAITGQRQDESAERAKRMQSQTIDGSFKTHEFKNCNLYAPIEFWNTASVWEHIYNDKLDWVDSNTLGRVYAEASNDGDECRSLLEGMQTGSKSGCGKSARYGCWCCMIFQKDKTLNSLTKHYPYMKEMEKLRNWFAKYRDGNWDINRDVFIHGKHKMKDYDYENHRKGMKIAGGYNLYFRKRMLSELLKCERKIIKYRKKPLITDRELAYIQQCWIEDGDLDFSVKKIAYDREFEHLIEPLYFKVIDSLEQLKVYSKKDDFKNFSWNNDWTRIMKKYLSVNNWIDDERLCDRYYCQMAIQLERRDLDSKTLLKILLTDDTKLIFGFILLLKTLPLEKSMDFVSKKIEQYIRYEWKTDKIGFITFLERLEKKEIEKPEKNLFGYNGDYGMHFEQLDELNKKGDIIDCKTISLQDKMRWFDRW